MRILVKVALFHLQRLSLVERLDFIKFPCPGLHIERGVGFARFSDARRFGWVALPTDKQTKNQTDNRGGFPVDFHPKILVVRVFDIAVRGFGGKLAFPAHALVLLPVFTFLLMSFAYHF